MNFAGKFIWICWNIAREFHPPPPRYPPPPIPEIFGGEMEKHAVAMVTWLTMTTALSNAGKHYLIVKDQVGVDPRKWKPLKRSLFHSAQVCTQQPAVAGCIRTGKTKKKRRKEKEKPRLISWGWWFKTGRRHLAAATAFPSTPQFCRPIRWIFSDEYRGRIRIKEKK